MLKASSSMMEIANNKSNIEHELKWEWWWVVVVGWGR